LSENHQIDSVAALVCPITLAPPELIYRSISSLNQFRLLLELFSHPFALSLNSIAHSISFQIHLPPLFDSLSHLPSRVPSYEKATKHRNKLIMQLNHL
jgi:hypothetical protein